MKHISVIPDVDVGKSGGGDADGTSGVVEETMLVALYHSCSVLILCMYLFFTLTNVLETSIILWPIQCFEPNNIRSTKTWVNGGRKFWKKKKRIFPSWAMFNSRILFWKTLETPKSVSNFITQNIWVTNNFTIIFTNFLCSEWLLIN